VIAVRVITAGEPALPWSCVTGARPVRTAEGREFVVDSAHVAAACFE